jgi:hypothetical protein
VIAFRISSSERRCRITDAFELRMTDCIEMADLIDKIDDIDFVDILVGV